MPGKHCFLLLLLQFIWLTDVSWAQRTPYSLQAAVDELHRREAAKYPLNAPPSQQHYFSGGLGAEQDYWDDDYNILANMNNNNNNYNNEYYNNLHNNHQKLYKALGKYLEREKYDADHGGLSLEPFGGWEFNEDNNNKMNSNFADDKRKRSPVFRERDNKYDVAAPSSVFRERESQVVNGADRSGLTEQFLREIEEAQEHEREERYKDALRHLWEKYQQQENEIEGDLFEEKKKRLRTPPYYMLMQKKRSAYPVLPWVTYAERKKRFPVAKRAAKRSTNEVLNLVREEKTKRSIQDATHPTSTLAPNVVSTSISDMRLEIPTKHSNATETTTKSVAPTAKPTNEVHQTTGLAVHHEHSQKHKHRKRSGDHSPHESHEHEEEDSEEHDSHEDEEGEEEDEHEDFEDEEEEQQKKKRDLATKKRAAEEAPKTPQQHKPVEMIMSRRKKSIEWSKYFGIDRKKKSEAMVKKRSANDRNADIDEEKKKRELDPEKLENMDKKLQSIEDFIIDETIKYTGAHEGVASPDEIRRLKDHVLSRLATAYSLEKMRRALEKLRQSVDNENHLLRNVVESDTNAEDNDALENQKRLSVKKETVQQNSHDSPASEKQKEQNSNAILIHNKHAHDDDLEDDEEEKKKQKKKRGYLRYPELPNEFSDFEEELGAGNYESLNDAYLGNKNYIIGSNQCPLIESMAERCRGVDLLSGDINQELLPICGVHQICYLCGTSQVACDYQYLAEADSLCGNSNDCQAAARSVLMILRGSPGPQVGPRECLKNPCLYSAMREIGL